MTHQDPPKIEFPCEFPIKVLGVQSDAFREHVRTVFSEHAADFDAHSSVKERPSGKGTFLAMTVVIEATGKPQLDAIHAALMTKPELVKMVI